MTARFFREYVDQLYMETYDFSPFLRFARFALRSGCAGRGTSDKVLAFFGR